MEDEANLALQTSHNKRFSEMAVGVEANCLLLPLTAYGILRCGAPHPPLRQAAGRYMTLALLRSIGVLTKLFLMVSSKV